MNHLNTDYWELKPDSYKGRGFLSDRTFRSSSREDQYSSKQNSIAVWLSGLSDCWCKNATYYLRLSKFEGSLSLRGLPSMMNSRTADFSNSTEFWTCAFLWGFFTRDWRHEKRLEQLSSATLNVSESASYCLTLKILTRPDWSIETSVSSWDVLWWSKFIAGWGGSRKSMSRLVLVRKSSRAGFLRIFELIFKDRRHVAYKKNYKSLNSA